MPTLLPKPPPMSGEMTRILCSGHAGHQGVERAVRVRGLGGGPHRQLAGDRVHVGHGAAGLQRRRVHPRVQHVLLHHDVGGCEDLVGALLVARLPVEDVVVGLLFLVVADHRRVRVERPAGVDDRRQRLVFDVDQFERVAGGVAVLGDDERDLLALEAHLVGGQHRLGVVGERRHPGQAETRQGLAGDDGLDLRVRLGGAGVDRDDPGVRVAGCAGPRRAACRAA